MSVSHWEFEGLEFAMLWEAIGRDRVPYPLHCRPRAASLADLTAQRRRAADRLRTVVDERVHHVLDALANPGARVEVSGYHDLDVNDPGRAVVTRLHGVVAGRTGVLAEQRPGATPDTGAEVMLTLTRPDELARALVDRLPPCAPGSRRGVVIDTSELVAPQRVTSALAAREPAVEAAGFFGRPRTSVGEVTVYPGGAVDSRPTGDGRTFHWYDYAGDGRYLVARGESVTARPVTAQDLAEEIARTVASVLT